MCQFIRYVCIHLAPARYVLMNNPDDRTYKSEALIATLNSIICQFTLSLSHAVAAEAACAWALVPDSSAELLILVVCYFMPGGRPTKQPKAVPVPRAATRVVPVTNITSDHDGNTHITTHSHAVMPDPPLPELPRYNPLNLEDSIQNEILDARSIKNTDTVS